MDDYYRTAFLISTMMLVVLCGYKLFFKNEVPKELLMMFALNGVLPSFPWLFQ